MKTYTIQVSHEDRDITTELAQHPAIDGWTPGGTDQPHADEGIAIGKLDKLTVSEALVCLSQIIDTGRLHGPTDDMAEHLYAIAERVMEHGEGYIATPDGYLIHLTSNDNFLDLLPDPKVTRESLYTALYDELSTWFDSMPGQDQGEIALSFANDLRETAKLIETTVKRYENEEE
jgi:hypothetical protein